MLKGRGKSADRPQLFIKFRDEREQQFFIKGTKGDVVFLNLTLCQYDNSTEDQFLSFVFHYDTKSDFLP